MKAEASTFPLQIAVLIPCYNEEQSIGMVVHDFKVALPDACVYVYDNNSTDKTVEVARGAGAFVNFEQRQGKGNVVRRMFSDVEADVYVLVDGDGTYDADSAPKLLKELVEHKFDMVVGVRMDKEVSSYRRGHRFGNSLLTSFVSVLFGRAFTDMLSGYRVFSRRFVKSFPALTCGFEIETELSVHALELRMPISEVETPYCSRPEGSFSKLNTWKDGFRILLAIITLFKAERPLIFFFIIFWILACTSLLLAYPILIMYLETGLVPRFPTAILSTGLMLLAFLSLACGLILETVTRGRQEMKRLFYLSVR